MPPECFGWRAPSVVPLNVPWLHMHWRDTHCGYQSICMWLCTKNQEWLLISCSWIMHLSVLRPRVRGAIPGEFEILSFSNGNFLTLGSPLSIKFLSLRPTRRAHCSCIQISQFPTPGHRRRCQNPDPGIEPHDVKFPWVTRPPLHPGA